MKKLLLFIALIIFVVVVDQVSKIYVFNNFRLGESVPVIDGFFNLTYVRNTGAAFGFGGGFFGQGQGTSVRYVCLTCNHRFKGGDCPRCGSKIKRADF